MVDVALLIVSVKSPHDADNIRRKKQRNAKDITHVLDEIAAELLAIIHRLVGYNGRVSYTLYDRELFSSDISKKFHLLFWLLN